MKRKWYSLNLLSLVKLCVFLGLPVYYFLPLVFLSFSVMTGHTVYVNTTPACLVVYDDKILPPNAAGATQGYVVYIQPELYNCPMVHAHEYTHVRQYWSSLGLHKFYYILSTKHRLLYEYDAYIEGLKYSTDLENDLLEASISLSHANYKLNLSPELAYMLLENGINKHRGK